MTQTFLLAEGLDILRCAELREQEVDRSQIRIGSSDKYRDELPGLVKAYDAVYRDYICGLEILTCVRRCAIEGNEAKRDKLIEMCERQMRTYMDRCDAVRMKKHNILFPINQLDEYIEEISSTLSSPMFTVRGMEQALKHNAPLSLEKKLEDGSYLLVVKNLDAYSVAAPLVTVYVSVMPELDQKQTFKKVLPCQCGWQHSIGVIGSATLKLVISSRGILRSSHIDVVFYKLNSTNIPNKSTGSVGNDGEKLPSQVPKISSDELAELINTNVPTNKLPEELKQGEVGPNYPDKTLQQLQSLKIPYTKGDGGEYYDINEDKGENIEINPAGLTCASRLKRLRKKLDMWPIGDVMAVGLSKEQQYTLQSVFALPFPTDINEGSETDEL